MLRSLQEEPVAEGGLNLSDTQAFLAIIGIIGCLAGCICYWIHRTSMRERNPQELQVASVVTEEPVRIRRNQQLVTAAVVNRQTPVMRRRYDDDLPTVVTGELIQVASRSTMRSDVDAVGVATVTQSDPDSNAGDVATETVDNEATSVNEEVSNNPDEQHP